MIKIEIPYELVSINQWMNWHWSKKANYKDEIKFAVWAVIKSANIDIVEKYPVQLEIVGYFRTAKRKDIDNYSGGSTIKAIIDGLVESGTIEDDSTEHISSILIKLRQSKNPRTEIIIRELQRT